MLHSSAKNLLSQLEIIVSCCKDKDFDRPLEELSNATLGQHIRHTLEFFICLFDAKNERVVNYDQRKHDGLIETDRKLALSVIQSIEAFLDKNHEDFELIFEANYSEREGHNLKIKSTYYRELAYNIEHAIHHLALIKVAINQSLSYIALPENFGVASSTIRFRSSSKS